MAKKKVAAPLPSSPKSTLLAFGFTSAKKVKTTKSATTTTKDDPSSPASSIVTKNNDKQKASILKNAKTTSILATTTKNNKKVEVPTTTKDSVSKQPFLRQPPPRQVPKKVAPMKKDKEQEATGGRPKRTRTTVSSYKDKTLDDDDDDDEHMFDKNCSDEEEDDEPPPTKRRLAQKPKAPAKATKKTSSKPSKQRKSVVDDDEDDFVVDDHSSEEEEDNMSLDDEEETKVKLGSKKTSKKTASLRKSASSSKTAALQNDNSSVSINNKKLKAEFDAKMAKDRKAYKPVNNPQKWPKNGSYVDPVGVDPTHGIVEGIISAQVRKVGRLLQLVSARQEEERRTTTNNKKKNGSKSTKVDNDSLAELSYPIRLQTACSGTDAPSIALGLIKESLDKLCAAQEGKGDSTNGSGGGAGHLFDYTHEMSCEIEPFKQAYIGRNFPGVPLFPDITKLTASEQVLDVYGRPQRIPKGNLFVAGTSCKDFSMLKTSYRLDIEDKGTSGETFLSAVEFLDQEQPPMAIFENVDGAPWGKMQEYIRGRIHLADRNDTKAIKDANKKAGE
jgi:C-5 cytosine-specific DNA methylase